MIPFLWWIAIQHARGWFVGVLAFTWFTDALDGYLARTYHLESKLGARLDSIADDAIQLSMPFWLWFLRPEVYQRYWYLVAIMLMTFMIAMLLQLRRRAPMHTWANKLTAWLLAGFLLYTFAFGLNVVLMWITFLGVMYAMVENIIILQTFTHADETTTSMWGRQ